MKNLTYEGSGVNYDAMDPFKRACQLAARGTARHLLRFGFEELEWTRGESVHVVKTPMGYLGFVVEGLGTKNLVADRFRWQINAAMRTSEVSKLPLYEYIAQCNFAMVANDMSTLGISPLVYGQHAAVGSSDWFKDERRWQELISGTVKACELARCCWGCGETPTLKDIILPEAAELSGASWGMSPAVFTRNIKSGDRIILLPSTGPHANGYTLARQIADSLPESYLTRLSDDTLYGEALLAATPIYSPIIDDCVEAGIDIRYGINITGHGWRKLMRADEPLVYVVEKIPQPQPVFDFIREKGPVTVREMYGNYNMGAGFALIAPEESVGPIQTIANRHDTWAMDAGFVEKQGDRKCVDIRPIGETYEGSELAVR